MSEVPTWLALVLTTVAGLVGNLAKPLFDFSARRAEATLKAAEALRDDMMRYATEVRAENATLKSQHEETRRWYIQTANVLVDFRTFVMTEAGHAQFHNDRKEHQEVARHLDNLIGGAKRLSLPIGDAHAVQEKPNAG
jgi:hypothetical protein